MKTSLAPGSTVVTDYLRAGGADEYLDGLRFNLVGYGCTTCIGNSGPLAPEISAAIAEKDLAVCAVLSGNRNFEGRINQDVKANYLASPPLVVAYALAGRMDIDIATEPLGEGTDGEPVYLRDIWPSAEEIKQRGRRLRPVGDVQRNYADVFTGDEQWNAVEVPEGDRYEWPDSTYVRQPPLLREHARRAARRRRRSRAPASSPSSATRSPPTTSRPPARSRRTARPGRWLIEQASSRATSTPTARAAATTR